MKNNHKKLLGLRFLLLPKLLCYVLVFFARRDEKLVNTRNSLRARSLKILSERLGFKYTQQQLNAHRTRRQTKVNFLFCKRCKMKI